MIIEELISTLTCEECGGKFKVEHDMGYDYIPQFCVFCQSEIYTEDIFAEQQHTLGFSVDGFEDV